MKRYLKLGLFTLVVLFIGLLLGSGAIGDMIRGSIAGVSAGADKAEVEATRENVANRLADRVGQPLAADGAIITPRTAMRCKKIAGLMLKPAMSDVSEFSEEELTMIMANANGVMFNGSGQETITQPQELEFSIAFNNVNNPEYMSEQDKRVLAVELDNVCSVLLGRR